MADWTERKDIEAAIELLDEGHSQTEVASLFGVAQSTVSKWWRKHRPDKVQKRGPQPGPERLRFKAMMLVLRDDKGIVEAAEAVGHSPADFSKWLKHKHPRVHALVEARRETKQAARELDDVIVRTLAENRS